MISTRRTIRTLALVFACLMLMLSRGVAQIPANGLAAYYPFSGDAGDHSGNGHTGTVVGAALTTDRFNQPASAYQFDGVDDEILLAGYFGGSSEISVSAWVYVDGTTGDFQAIFESAEAAINPVLHLQLNTYGNNVVYTGAYPAQGIVFLPILTPTPYAEWRHIVLTSKSGETRLYQNGTSVGQNNMAFSVITQNMMKIGSGCANGRYFKGKIDDVRVYTRALNSSEVQLLHLEYPQPVADAGADQLLTLGFGPQSITLSASASGGSTPYSYQWSTNAVTQSIVVSPQTTTTYTVTVTDANAQTASDDVVVEVLDWRCGNNMDKVKICHNGHTICVSLNAVQAHLDHGDNLGDCISAKSPSEGLPHEYSLRQNYPNPFNPTTMISYDLPSSGQTKLVIYDMFGREVAQLVDEPQSAGSYQIPFDGSSCASGMYLYRLESGSHVQTRTMTLIK